MLHRMLCETICWYWRTLLTTLSMLVLLIDSDGAIADNVRHELRVSSMLGGGHLLNCLPLSAKARVCFWDLEKISEPWSIPIPMPLSMSNIRLRLQLDCVFMHIPANRPYQSMLNTSMRNDQLWISTTMLCHSESAEIHGSGWGCRTMVNNVSNCYQICWGNGTNGQKSSALCIQWSVSSMVERPVTHPSAHGSTHSLASSVFFLCSQSLSPIR